MKLRKIKLGLLGLSGIAYRIHVIIIQTIFFWFLTGKWEWAIGMSLTWNCVNTFLYYNFHYFLLRVFKFGKKENEKTKNT